MHCDTISKLWEKRQMAHLEEKISGGLDGEKEQLDGLLSNNLHIDLQRMKKAGYILQNFAMYIDLKRGLDPFDYVLALIGVFQEEMEKNKNEISPVMCYADFIENINRGKLSALMTIEEGGCCKGDIANLEKLYDLGARMMTLTWNYPNELASPNIVVDQKNDKGFYLFDGTKGLTATGFSFIERMEELGIIIDVSHLSDAGFWDVAAHTKKPFVASHSNARTLCEHARNLTDEMIRTIADSGGVIGLNFYGEFLNEINQKDSYVKRMVDHVRHIIQVGGSDCLGLGSDFDGIDGTLEMKDCSQLYKFVEELERQHISDTQIEKILYQNTMRVYREVL